MNAEVPDPLLLEHLTWPEVELALTRGTTTVVIPVGAIEQHGPHLPLSVDALRGEALGRRVVRALGDALLGPPIRVGCSEHHMGFAGTVSIRPETLEAICRDYCTSLARHGFREIFFVPSHGGNFKPLADMVPRLQEAVDEVSADCRVVAYTDLLGIIAVWRWVVEEEAGLGVRVGGHADIAESSETLHLQPALVRVERAEKGTVGELDQAAVERIFAKGLRAISPNGVLGDARGMSAQLGEQLLDATARVIVQAFREEGEVHPSAEAAGALEAGRSKAAGAEATAGGAAVDPLDDAEALTAELLDGAHDEEGYAPDDYLDEDDEESLALDEEYAGFDGGIDLDDPEEDHPYDPDEEDERYG